MKFIAMIRADESVSLGPPPPSLLAAIQAHAAAAAEEEGTVLEFAGLQPSAAGTRIEASDGQVAVTDGPFAEAKEVVGGFAVFESRSKEAAVDMLRRFLELHVDHWPGFGGVCEVREVVE